MSDNWTNEHIATLKRLWKQGLPTSQIALQLGDWCTKNSVIGKAHRLNLPGRQGLNTTPTRSTTTRVPKRPVAQRRKKQKSAEPKATSAKETVVKEPTKRQRRRKASDVTMPVFRKLNLMELSNTTCRWPLGDPHHKRFCFCGNDTNNPPYCTYHAKLAFEPLTGRRRIKGV